MFEPIRREFRRRFHRLPLASGGRIGAGGGWERWNRRAVYIHVPAFLGLGRLGLGLVLPTSLGFTVAGSFCAGAALAGGGRCCSWWVSRLRRLQILGPLLNSLAGTTGSSDGVDGVSAGILEAPVERWSASRAAASTVGDGATGRGLQRLGCNLFYFQS